MKLQHYQNKQGAMWTLMTGKGAPKAVRRHVQFSDYSSAVVVSDDHVAPLWLKTVQKQLRIPQSPIIIIPHGERSKNFSTVQRILQSLFDQGIDRHGLLIALGGGVVGDITGFAASIYKRGLDYIQIPTSLIALSDSAIGGKTGIDFAGWKNSVGTFYQPRVVACDPMFLATLPLSELVNGMAEVIKYGLIADKKFFDFLSSYTLDDMPWGRVIDSCAQYKANIVARDERDMKGLRALLNFGHTVGHAIEALSNYRVPHGKAIAIGMTAEARMSGKVSGLSEQECGKIEHIFKKFGLPTRIPAGMKVGAIMEKIGADKKVRSGRVEWVLLRRIGKAVSGVEVAEKVVRRVLEELIRR